MLKYYKVQGDSLSDIERFDIIKKRNSKMKAFANYISTNSYNIESLVINNVEVFRTCFDIADDIEVYINLNHINLIEIFCYIKKMTSKINTYPVLELINELNKHRGIGKYLLERDSMIMFRSFQEIEEGLFSSESVIETLSAINDVLKDDCRLIDNSIDSLFIARGKLEDYYTIISVISESKKHIEFVSESENGEQYKIVYAEVEDNQLLVYDHLDFNKEGKCRIFNFGIYNEFEFDDLPF